jgi:uncharacterized membrane protein YesL
MASQHWTARVHAACSVVAWWGALNALWIVFTLLGGIVLGIGPATVAACVVCRARARGDAAGVRAFAAVWRREFRGGNAVVGPVVAVVVLLWLDYAYFAQSDSAGLGPRGDLARVATLVALVVAVGAGAYVGPMYAHHEMPWRLYAVRSLRFALARPASTVLLLFVAAAVAAATAALPVLLVTVSIGAWLHSSTWLCLRFFGENEARLNSPTTRPDGPRRGLPVEPLRIR